VLLYAQLRGNNQGIAKIATGGVPKADTIKAYAIVKRNKCGALVSGGNAMVASHNAARLACELAAEHGVGVVGSSHTFSSSGAIGYFAREIADAGYIGIVCVGSGPFVVPAGSSEAKLGTNPISYAFPTKNHSVVFDMTTAAMAYFGVVEAKLKGEPLPEGVGFDEHGSPTTDAAAALNGAVAPLAGHKGSGLSLLVQLLGGPFVGAGFAGLHSERGAGTFVLAIDPGLFAGKEQYLAAATELTDAIKAAKPLPGQQVLLPGERGDTRIQLAEASNEVEIADGIWNELLAFVSA
jgi:LDH2 family malate/lactate/ureidoglycolate dehydrogenase